VYNIEVPNAALPDNGRYLSVDIGLDNLATVVNNVGLKPIVINGKGLKSMNKYYNKQISHYREVAKRINGRDYTSRMDRLTCKRNHKIDDYMHKASKFLIDYAVVNNFNTIVIGNNKEWKQESSMSKRVNQSFVGIPHMRFIQMVQYKAQTAGLNVILTEESYTSGTSFLDNEEPIKANYNKVRRVKRGLFVSNNGTKINADVNGAYQIMKKVFPNVTSDGIQGVALHPVRVSVA
jgi:putative transposase